jgi:hypothetical protein
MFVMGMKVFVSKDANTGVTDVYAKDVMEVEIARNKGETAEKRGVTQVESEDAGGFVLVLS